MDAVPAVLVPASSYSGRWFLGRQRRIGYMFAGVSRERRGCWPSVLKVRRWLLGLRKLGGGFGLEVPATAFVGGGEFRSKREGAWGVAPADGLLGDGLFFCGSISKRLCVGVPFALQVGGGGRSRRSPAAGFSGAFGLQRARGLSCNFLFLRAFSVRWVGQLSSVSLYDVHVLGLVFVCSP